jgi:tetratricopeptide (TPR) repeat protein
VRFHDEWSGEPETLERLLRLVLRIDVGIGWAFERMTMTLTLGERWGELLALYDQALLATSDLLRRREILDEAAHVAKDFAGQPDRAIDYLWQLLQLRPSDGALASSLERLLEAKGHHRELVRLWELRASVLEGEPSRALRLRAALCWVERVDAPEEAVRALEPLLRERYEEPTVVATLEKIAAHEGHPDAVRSKAYGLLEVFFEESRRESDELRVLEGALGVVATDGERIRLHRRAAALLEQHGEDRRALDHLARLVPLVPGEEAAAAALRKLGERTEAFGPVAHALAGAADALGEQPRALALREEAAGLLCDRVNERAEAARLYLQVFWAEGAAPEQARRVGERLWRERLLIPEQTAELLPALERLFELGPGEEELAPEAWRHELLGETARVAQSQGQPERALRAWELRLQANPEDDEAIHGRIDALELLQRWEPLVQALQDRADRAADEEARRKDLVRIAKVVAATVGDTERAIEAWRSVEEKFGREDDTVDALAELYEQAGKADDLEQLLQEAERQAPPGERRAELKARLGELRAARGEPEAALEAFLAALSDHATNGRARRGLRGLLDRPELAASALGGLVASCERSDDWRERLLLLEFRLQATEDEITRAEILVEAAGDLERRAGDLPGAHRALGRAIELSPGSVAIERDLLRLAEQTDLWKETASALAHGLASAAALVTLGGPPRRAHELRIRLGNILEERLGELPKALEAYRGVALEDPRFPGALASVLRVGARLELPEVIAEALLQATTTAGSLPQELAAVVEGNTTSREQWQATSAALEKLLERPEVSSPARHALLLQLGRWHRDPLQNEKYAEQLLEQAVALDPSAERAIEELADLQRKAPSPALVNTLRRLSEARGGDEVALREAAEIALDRLGDEETGLALLETLHAVARRRWLGDEPASTPEPPAWYVAWAQERLTELRERRGEIREAILVLQEGTRLPFPRDAVLAMLHRGAALARERLGELAQAASLYREALALDPRDPTALAALAEIYKETGAHEDLLGLRRHELGLSLPLERRLELRLDLARTAAQLGDEALRTGTLRENLQEHPGHPASIEEITAALQGTGKLRELLALLSEQAGSLESLGEPAAARPLWLRAAELAEHQLGDPSEAINALLRAARLAETPETLDTLGRLYTTRGEPAAAIPWLERRLAGCRPEERPATVQRLAAALGQAGRVDEARRHLEAILQEAPQDRAIRGQLIALYRSTQAWSPLVDLALSAAEQEDDTQTRLGLFLEAADVLLRRLGDPGRAVDLLRKASALAPQDRGLRTGLADALRASGRLDEAQRSLEELLAEFGRRRPPERAAVHFQLAQIAQARGDVAGALAQLDTAASIDMAHGGVLLLLGRLAHGAGQLDRAERAYRALLLLLRRQRPDAPPSHQVDLGVAELTFEIYRIASQLGQGDRATELLESAFEIASQSSQEATRLERALQGAGETGLLLRALGARLQRATSREDRAAAHLALALAHEQLHDAPAAFDALEQAIRLDPERGALHECATRLSREAPLHERYTSLLRELASEAAAEQAAELWLRLSAFHESRGELAEAVAACEQACSTGFRLLDGHQILVRLRGTLGDLPGKLASQRVLVDLLGNNPALLADALYALAATELSSPDTQESGASSLERALALSPRPQEALALLRAHAPGSTSRGLLALYEQVARRAEDRATLLDALERLSHLPDSGDDVFREAAELADLLGELPRAEALLQRAVESTGGVWAMTALAERSRAGSRWKDAQQWFHRAAEALGGDEGFELGLEAARIAADSLKNASLATQSYLRLWQARPGERRVWEPLLALLREAGDAEQLDTVLAGSAAAVDDPASRRALRMERAEALLEDPFRQEDAISALQDMLQEDPGDSDAQGLLLRIYEQTGRTDDLVGLLRDQLEEACRRPSPEEASALALRLGALLARKSPDEAREVYRTALRAAPDDAMLLRELLALLGPAGDPTERAPLLERLLRDDAVSDGARLAAQLADAHAAANNDDGTEAALRRGLALAPDDATLRQRIEEFYTSRRRWRPLVDLLLHEAENHLDPQEAAARFHQAARLLAKQLGEPRQAVDLLRRARTLAPDDLDLLRTLVDALLDAGDQDAARAEVNAALERTYVENATRAQLLRLNALLALRQGKEADAVAALEQALSLGAQEASGELAEALEQLRQAAPRRGDGEAERAATLRLAELHLQSGATEQGLDLLRQWTSRQPGDLAALRTLLDLEAAAGNWPAVIDLSNRLIAADPDETKTEAALRLLDACTRAGHPADARPGLELAFASFPRNAPVRSALKQLYEQLGAQRELADILLHEAADMENEADRFAPYRRAAELYLATGFAPNAIPVLEAALHAKPGDHDCTVLLADCYIAMNQLEQATNLLDATIAGHKNKRSPALSVLQHRMARVALAAGDRSIEVQWLNAALDSDAQNTQVAAELADAATEIGQLDLAHKALRAITVAKNPGPMSKGMAFYRQGLISYHQGDQRKAVVMVKRGLQEDPSLAEARTFLEQLGEKV